MSVIQARIAGSLIVLWSLVGLTTNNLATAQTLTTKGAGANPLAQLNQVSRLSPIFIENRGQFDPRVRFQVKIGAQIAWLTTDGVVFDAIRTTDATKEPDITPASVGVMIRQEARSPVSFNIASRALRTIDRLVFSEDFVGGQCCSRVEGKDLRAGVYNYFQGRDPGQWRTNVRSFGEVIYHDVWPGVDLRIYGKGADLEQEFLVQPGASLNQVQISYRGIDRLNVDADGSLEVETALGRLRETPPQIYQQIAGKRVAVRGRFKLTGEASYTFDVATYAAQYPVLIDPTLLYSTFLGGSTESSNEVATGIAIDDSGNSYIVGNTASTDFPTTIGAFQTSPASGSFLTKLNATGTALVYSTYLGSTSSISAVAVDSAGNAYVTGGTFATYYFGSIRRYFPTTANAYWPTDSDHQCAPFDIFVTKLNAAGNQLLYSTCLNYGPGNGPPSAIAVDSRGRAVIAGTTNGGLPTTPNAYQGSYPGTAGTSAFVTMFDTSRSGAASLSYSSYFGNPLNNFTTYGATGNAVAMDPSGNIYLAGSSGEGLPITVGAFQQSLATGLTCNPYGGQQWNCPDAFVAKFNPSAAGLQGLIYSTYLGGLGFDYANAIAVDAAGSAYVTGDAGASGFPVTAGAFQTNSSCGSNLFVTKLDAAGSKLLYSTYLGANCYANNNSVNGIAVDSLGNAYVAGDFRAQASSAFPVTPDAFQNSFAKASGDFHEAFLAKVNPAGSDLAYSSYLGGFGDDVATAVAVDSVGDAYVAGHTSSTNFPTTTGVLQPTMKGTGDVFVAKFPLGAVQTLSISSVLPSSGGNTGTLTTHILGGGFHAGLTDQLGG